MRAKFGFVAMGIFSVMSSAFAQSAGDAQKGQALARVVCAECHAVAARQDKSPNPKAPAFAQVASTAGMTELALRVWLQSSHPTMPNLVLSAEERDNVIAYISSLKGTAP